MVAVLVAPLKYSETLLLIGNWFVSPLISIKLTDVL